MRMVHRGARMIKARTREQEKPREHRGKGGVPLVFIALG